MPLKSSAGAASFEAASTAQGHRESLFPWVKPYYREPLVLTEGRGVWVGDENGAEYLDLFAGILTTSVGHCNPTVIERVTEQLHRLGHTSTLYVTEQQVEVARTLSGMAPPGLVRAAFLNSGTEANETAITAACAYTGRSEIVALRHAYSGRSALATNLTGHAGWRPLPAMVPGISHARSPYPYRSPFGPDVPDEVLTGHFIDDLVETIETTTSGKPAALLVEPIQGVGGFVVPPRGYLKAAAEVIRGYGGLFISDEVQTGFGRTGVHWFACEHDGVVPDLMVMAKGIANGFPVGAVLAREEIAEAWTANSISTYGGNPISMAATAATLEVMQRENVPERARERGCQLERGLIALADQFPWIGEVRGRGLMQAMELVKDRRSKEADPERAKAVMEAARTEGLLVGAGGLHGHVIRIGPSLLISGEEMAEALDRLTRACESVA